MDPIACALGAPNHALFLDTRSLSWELVPIPSTAEFAVINSGISHSHATGGYRDRRHECDAATKALGLTELRELPEAELHRLEGLPDVLQKRARHIVTENSRVVASVEALRKRDLPTVGVLMNASHDSLRDDYEVSIREIDRMVEVARDQPGVFGARITGGGFGGSIVILAQNGQAARVASVVAQTVRDELGISPQVMVPPPRA